MDEVSPQEPSDSTPDKQSDDTQSDHTKGVPESRPAIDGLIRFGLKPLADDDREACDKIASEVRKQPPAADSTDGILLSGTGRIPVPTDPAARYELGEEIGRGGVGEVLRGRDTTLGRKVAVKVLGDEHAENPQMVRRFIEEAQIGGQLQHPGVVPVHDVGYHDDGRPFFAMKLVDGSTLAELLQARRHPREDRRRFLTIFEKICQTIAFAHARGVVHRDLKPSNIMVGAYGEVQVMDWGLAKVLARRGPTPDRTPIELTEINTVRTSDADSRSETGSVMGTPAYMPPEQARGEVELIDERADVFALGGLLCQILTGAPPYTGDYHDVRSRAQRGQVDDAYERIEDAVTDEELKDLARDCLQPERDRRPEHAGIVADRFAAYRTGVDERAQAAALDAARARSRSIAMLVGALAILTIGTILFFQERSRIGRVERTTAELIDGIEDANRALAAARAKPEDAAAWSVAESAAKSVQKLTALDDVIDSERRRGEKLADDALREVALARAQMARLARERDMIHRIERLHAMRSPFDRGRAALGYLDAFADFGIDLDALSVEDAARTVRESPIAEALLRGLDALLASGTRGSLVADRPALDKLPHVLLIADKNPERQGIRHAIAKRDVAGLARIAKNLRPESASAQTFFLSQQHLATFDQFDAAIALGRRAAAYYPQDFWINYQLANHLLMNGNDRGETLKYFEIARAIRPDRPSPRVNIASLLLDQGDTAAAEAEVRRAIALNDQWPAARYQLGAILRKKGENEAGLAEMREALKLNPNSPHLHYEFGKVLLRARDPGALEAFERTVEIAPGHLPALRHVGQLRAKAGDRDGALEAFRTLIRLGRRVEKRGSDAAAVHRKLGYDIDAALAHAYTFVAEYHDGANRIADAIAAYRNAWKRGRTTNPIPGGQLAKVLLRVGRLDEATKVSAEVIERFPTFPFGYATHGEALRQRGQYAKAIEIHRTGNEQSSRVGMRYPGALARIAKQHAKAAEWIAARNDADAWPEDPRRLVLLATVLEERGDAEAAVDLWATALETPDAWKPGSYVTQLAQGAKCAGFAAKKAKSPEGRATCRERAAAWLVRAIDGLLRHATVSEATRRGAAGVFDTWRNHAALEPYAPRNIDALPDGFPAALKSKLHEAWARTKQFGAGMPGQAIPK